MKESENRFAFRKLNPDHPASNLTSADIALPFSIPSKPSDTGLRKISGARGKPIPLSKITYISDKSVNSPNQRATMYVGSSRRNPSFSQFKNIALQDDSRVVPTDDQRMKTPATSASTLKISRSQWGQSEFDHFFQSGAISPNSKKYKPNKSSVSCFPESPTHTASLLQRSALKNSDGFTKTKTLGRHKSNGHRIIPMSMIRPATNSALGHSHSQSSIVPTQRVSGVAAARSREDLKNAEGKTIIRIRPQTPKINLLEIQQGLRGGRAALRDAEEQGSNAINFALLQNNIDSQIENILKGGELDGDILSINEDFLSSHLGLAPSEFMRIKKIEFKINAQRHDLQAVGEYLCNLQMLHLSNSIVPSIRDIGTSFKRLKVLWISRCGLKDIGGLVAFEKLEELYASFNHVDDLYDLTYLNSLKILDLEGNDVSDLEQIEHLSSSADELISINFVDNPVARKGRAYYEKVFSTLECFGKSKLHYFDDEMVEEIKERLSKGDYEEVKNEREEEAIDQERRAMEQLLEDLNDGETKNALETSVLLAEVNSDDEEEQRERVPFAAMTDGFLRASHSQKRICRIQAFSSSFSRELSFLKKMQQQGIIGEEEVTQQFKNALGKLKAEPVEEELLLKSIKTKKFEKPEARIKRPIQAENSQVGMFYKTSGPFFSAASELKENKNITNFYDDKVEEEDEPFVSEILNNPEQKAFAGNPLQAAKLRKKNRLESNAQGTGNDIEKLLDQFKNTHQQIMRKVEEKTRSATAQLSPRRETHTLDFYNPLMEGRVQTGQKLRKPVKPERGLGLHQ